MKKLPKKHEAHENPRISRQQLENVFGNWNIYEIADSGSGIEYGQDYMIEVVREDGSVTGNEFRVQSKVLRKKSSFTQNYIGDNIDVATINYLLELPVPVLIHFIDGRTDDNSGYIIWLDNWLAKNPKQTWKDQETKKLNIPLEHLFDKVMVASIEKFVGEFYFVHNSRKRVDHINKYSNDHFVVVQADSNSNNITYIIHPRHNNAIPQITPLDDEAIKSINNAIEHGIPTSISGSFNILNIPDDLIDTEEMELIGAFVVPKLKSADPLPVRIRFINEEGNEIFSIPYLDLKPIQISTKIRKWEASISKFPMVFSLKFDVDAKKIAGGISRWLDFEVMNNPRVILGYFEFVRIYNQSVSIEIELLRNKHIITHSIPETIIAEAHKEYLDALENLVYFMDKCGVETSVPKSLTVNDIEQIKDVTQILKTGLYSGLLNTKFREENKLPLKGSWQEVKELLGSLENKNERFVALSNPIELVTKVLDIEINLGVSDYILFVKRLVNKSEVISQISEKKDNITLYVEFDSHKSYTQFPKWLPEDTGNT